MSQEQALQDILETVTFIKDNAASKADLAAFELRVATKEDVHEIVDAVVGEAKRDIMTTLDALVVLHKKLFEELTAVQANYRRLDTRILQLAKHVNFSFQSV